MPARDIFIDTAAEEGWSDATQIDVLLRYIENQQSFEAFEDFLAELRADALTEMDERNE